MPREQKNEDICVEEGREVSLFNLLCFEMEDVNMMIDGTNKRSSDAN